MPNRALALLAVLALSCAPAAPTAQVDTTDDAEVDVPQPVQFSHLSVGGADMELRISAGQRRVSDVAIADWTRRAATAVSAYFDGHFPVRAVTITIVIRGDEHVSDGLASPAGIRVILGSRVRQRDLDDDWVMTHEMFHLAFPDLDDQHHWLREGLASYLEPLARARIGTLTPERVWGDLAEGLPQGQPEPGDAGLDHTHTWGRTYWGGAAFCLLADLKIREQTHNAKSLDDAMRAILQQGGDIHHHWPIAKVIEAADRATGTTVLRDLYADMADHPVQVDFDALWKRLGVSRENGRVKFDDAAQLATIRRSMTQPR